MSKRDDQASLGDMLNYAREGVTLLGGAAREELAANRVHRVLFPYPHQPSLRKLFYRERLGEYTAFFRTSIFAH